METLATVTLPASSNPVRPAVTLLLMRDEYAVYCTVQGETRAIAAACEIGDEDRAVCWAEDGYTVKRSGLGPAYPTTLADAMETLARTAMDLIGE